MEALTAARGLADIVLWVALTGRYFASASFESAMGINDLTQFTRL